MPKVIQLTESQFNQLVLEEKQAAVLCEAFAGMDLKQALENAKKYIKNGVKIGAVIAALAATYNLNDADKEKISNFLTSTFTQNNNNTQNTMANTFDSEKFNNQVNAVDEYMRSVASLNGYNPNDIQLTPQEIVKQCYAHNFKISNLLAHLHQESCFGLTPRARKTNSPFSVGSWDNGSNKTTYATQDDSIDSFLNLIEKDYMRDGKTYQDLISGKNSFVNFQNNRYAQDPNYEKKIQQLTNRVEKAYPILGELQ